MSMDAAFKKMLEGVRMADEGRDEIMKGLEAAWEGRKDLDTQITEMRETIGRLETLVMEQGRNLRALRDRLNGGE
jgi:hypothetical protein